MEPISRPIFTRLAAGLGIAAGLAFVVYVVAAGLGTIGYHLVVVGVLRLLLLPALLVLVNRLGRPALATWGAMLAALGGLATLVGAIALVLLDGWTFNPFAVAGGSPPGYAFVIGVGAMAFAAGTALCGLAALRRGQTLVGALALLAGVLYLGAIPLAAVGHLIWIASWIALSAALVMGPVRRPLNTAH